VEAAMGNQFSLFQGCAERHKSGARSGQGQSGSEPGHPPDHLELQGPEPGLNTDQLGSDTDPGYTEVYQGQDTQSGADQHRSVVITGHGTDHQGLECSAGHITDQQRLECSAGHITDHQGVECSAGHITDQQGLECSAGHTTDQQGQVDQARVTGEPATGEGAHMEMVGIKGMSVYHADICLKKSVFIWILSTEFSFFQLFVPSFICFFMCLLVGSFALLFKLDLVCNNCLSLSA